MKIIGNSWKLKFWRVPHLEDIKLMHVSNLTHDYPHHIHEEFCILLIFRGTETHICRGNSFKAVAGNLMLLNATEAHSTRSVAAEYRAIHILPERTHTN
jgi:hypothetical protein